LDTEHAATIQISSGAVHRFEGMVQRFTGDGILALFWAGGAPAGGAARLAAPPVASA
jgi:class 3 adenylate cyclase